MRQSAQTQDRPEGWPVDLPPRSFLFGVTPYGFDGATRESLVSFFRRTSDAHALLPRSLAYHSIVPLTEVASKNSADSMADECYRLELCGLSTKAARWIDCLNQLTARSDLESLTLFPLKHFVSSYQLIEHTNRFCPTCYAEDELAGRQKYDRLLWTVRCVSACPKHERLLTSEARGKCHSRMPFTAPGISRNDGSSLARFTSGRAPGFDVICAGLVANFIDEITPIDAQKASSITAFLTHAADALFNGNSAALALHLGLSKSQVHGWMHDGILPSLAGLIRIAYAFECAIADVILGSEASLRLRRACKLPYGLFRLSRRVGYKTPQSELLDSLVRFTTSNPGASAQEAANHLEVSPKFLRETFPEQNKSLVNAHRSFVNRNSQAMRDAKDDAFKQSCLALSKNGTYPSRRKVVAPLKKLRISFTYADEKRAIRKTRTL
ncbi:TniQ family protein [Paraburkholderia sabiae]|uniref:TniQ family protein n=1 Tax=Paraburkholderia sabiae TaxID=273251 RepID=A0ABU9QN00_9BURK|nr:TniQ family protein [Paraburkholderia sabiae]WJZ72164.1 TniQ family protein [Paraburkholderia sabiae]CAD6561592.1 hypothetical protein LMG24235_07356 [Paraburkholderia sabiae]